MFNQSTVSMEDIRGIKAYVMGRVKLAKIFRNAIEISILKCQKYI